MTDLVCGITVPASVRRSWSAWFAPERVPFRLERLTADDRASLPSTSSPDISMELQDTFWIYGDDKSRLWHSRAEFEALPTRLRRRLLAAQRAEHEVWRRGPAGRYGPWWPDSLAGDTAPIVEFIERDCDPSRHTEVSEATWSAAAAILPNARELAGTFADGSGPNCFGTVMGAAGIDGAAFEWMQREPFEAWLSEHTTPVGGTGADHEPGVVFVWRSTDGAVQHACVTLGEGWMLNKPSQGWMTPRFVWTVEQAKRHARYPGLRLKRCRIVRSDRPGGAQ